MRKLKPKQLRKSNPSQKQKEKLAKNPIVLVLDEIYDTFNIGSLFRLADAVGAEKMYLCKNMQYPPNSRIHKAAVGTENWVEWEKTESTIDTVNSLKEKGYQIVTIEQSESSLPFTKIKKEHFNFPIAIIVGNETQGVAKEVLEVSDLAIELPMYGINNSFNVWGTAAVACYKAIEILENN